MAVGAAAIATQDATQAGQPYRVCDNVSRPEIISSKASVYTKLARRARVSGTVIVEGRGKGASRLDRLLEANPQDSQQLEVYRAETLIYGLTYATPRMALTQIRLGGSL